MKYFVLLLIAYNFSAYSQQSERWVYGVENQKDIQYALKDSIFTEKYSKFNFSNLLSPKTEIVGFIGTEYKRIKIDFIDVKKSNDYNTIYKVFGKSIIGSNTCDFSGSIKIKKIREYHSLHLGLDNIYADSGIVSQGVIIAEYELNESMEQKFSGTFKGVMTLWFYVDKSGEIKYDNIVNHSDSYRNNQYVGEWSQYGSGISKTCNWGEFRVPLCGDLDIGAGEFSVNPKYQQNGW